VIIITIMVLDLKAPRDASLNVLMELWPTLSLMPLLTAYMAETRASLMLLQKALALQFGAIAELRAMDRAATKRNWIALAAYPVAIAAAYLHRRIRLSSLDRPAKRFWPAKAQPQSR
jgi:uncharacterized membrane protein